MSHWLRLYADMLNDAKVQTLPLASFKAWVNALCLAAQLSSSNGSIGTIEDVSFAFRETKEGVSSAFQPLIDKGLIVTVGETFHLASWKKRQFKSDSSTDRVREHRKKKHVTGNVTETPQIQSRADTDTEQNREEVCGEAQKRPRPPKPPVVKIEFYEGEANEALIDDRAIVPISTRFDPHEEWGEFASKLGLSREETLRELEKFISYFTVGKGAGKRRSKRGWRQSWGNWLGKFTERKM